MREGGPGLGYISFRGWAMRGTVLSNYYFKCVRRQSKRVQPVEREPIKAEVWIVGENVIKF
jgi:hypothetical protein